MNQSDIGHIIFNVIRKNFPEIPMDKIILISEKCAEAITDYKEKE